MRQKAVSRGGPPRWSFGEWMVATETILARDQGRCGWCTRGLGESGVRHHRKRRREGGDSLPNVVILHDACHKEVHAYPSLARERGYIVSVHLDPAAEPIQFALQWYLLDPDGGRERVHR